MKTENKTNDTFDVESIIALIIVLISLIGAVITVIFGYPHLDFPDDWCEYIFGAVVFTFAYIIGLYLLVAIIGLLIAFIMCLFIKNNKESD